MSRLQEDIGLSFKYFILSSRQHCVPNTTPHSYVAPLHHPSEGPQARPQGRATGAPAQGPQKYGAPKLNYVLTISAVSQKKNY